jgi:hypothetical protein
MAEDMAEELEAEREWEARQNKMGSDLQSRLDAIKERADGIRKKAYPAASADAEALAEMVGYLALILKKHLENGER